MSLCLRVAVFQTCICNYHIAILKKKIIIFTCLLFSLLHAGAQPRFSIANDIGLQRNFKKEQQFWTIGHTTQAQIHLTQKEGVYGIFAYYARGKYSNRVTATAKSASTVPQQVVYTNDARMRLKQFSLGYRRYFKGSYDAEGSWSLYGFGGLGLLLGTVDNNQSPLLDTLVYALPVQYGRARFKRLTLELGAGWEKLLGGDIYFYSEGKVWVPTTDYPSKYLLVNDQAPFVAMLAAGIRVVF